MSFEKYLQQANLRESTIRGHLNDLKRFKKWCSKEGINPKTATYNHLLKFIRQARARGVSKSSVNIHLNSIGKYYDHLIETGERNVTLSGAEANPAKDLRLKNSHKKVLQNLLNPEELEDIYMNYINIPQWKFKGERSRQGHKRNIAILGLMVYQGIQPAELRKIEKTHLNLLQGTVYIPAAGRSNSRILKLNARQIIPLQEYLQNTDKEGEKLFNCKMTSAMSWLISTLKKQSEQVKNAQQIRSSVIMNWLKQYNIRQVQYMAGHRHIGSTERYKQEDLQDLQAQLNLFHPLVNFTG